MKLHNLALVGMLSVFCFSLYVSLLLLPACKSPQTPYEVVDVTTLTAKDVLCLEQSTADNAEQAILECLPENLTDPALIDLAKQLWQQIFAAKKAGISYHAYRRPVDGGV